MPAQPALPGLPGPPGSAEGCRAGGRWKNFLPKDVSHSPTRGLPGGNVGFELSLPRGEFPATQTMQG